MNANNNNDSLPLFIILHEKRKHMLNNNNISNNSSAPLFIIHHQKRLLLFNNNNSSAPHHQKQLLNNNNSSAHHQKRLQMLNNDNDNSPPNHQKQLLLLNNNSSAPHHQKQLLNNDNSSPHHQKQLFNNENSSPSHQKQLFNNDNSSPHHQKQMLNNNNPPSPHHQKRKHTLINNNNNNSSLPLLLILLLLLPSFAAASTFTVPSPQYPTIADAAFVAVNDGDVIQVVDDVIGCGNNTDGARLRASIVILGINSWEGKMPTVSCSSRGRAINAVDVSRVKIENIRFAEGYRSASGGAVYVGGKIDRVEIRGCEFLKNEAHGSYNGGTYSNLIGGGGLAIFGRSNIEIIIVNNKFISNKASNAIGGGAAYIFLSSASNVTLDDRSNQYIGGNADWGGGVGAYFGGNTSNSFLSIGNEGALFSNNTSSENGGGGGGGVYVLFETQLQNSILNIGNTNSLFQSNSARSHGGAISLNLGLAINIMATVASFQSTVAEEVASSVTSVYIYAKSLRSVDLLIVDGTFTRPDDSKQDFGLGLQVSYTSVIVFTGSSAFGHSLPSGGLFLAGDGFVQGSTTIQDGLHYSFNPRAPPHIHINLAEPSFENSQLLVDGEFSSDVPEEAAVPYVLLCLFCCFVIIIRFVLPRFVRPFREPENLYQRIRLVTMCSGIFYSIVLLWLFSVAINSHVSPQEFINTMPSASAGIISSPMIVGWFALRFLFNPQKKFIITDESMRLLMLSFCLLLLLLSSELRATRDLWIIPSLFAAILVTWPPLGIRTSLWRRRQPFALADREVFSTRKERLLIISGMLGQIIVVLSWMIPFAWTASSENGHASRTAIYTTVSSLFPMQTLLYVFATTHVYANIELYAVLQKRNLSRTRDDQQQLGGGGGPAATATATAPTEAETETARETVREEAREAAREIVREESTEVAREAARKAETEAARDAAREEARKAETEAEREAARKEAAEAARGAARKESTEAVREAARETVREAARKESTEAAPEAARKESTEAATPTEAEGEVALEAPTETAIEIAPETDNDETDDDEVETEAVREAVREQSAEAAIEESTEAAAEAAREAVRDAAREESTETAREAETEAAREAVREAARGAARKESTEAVREAARETVREAARKESTEAAPEAARKESTEAATPTEAEGEVALEAPTETAIEIAPETDNDETDDDEVETEAAREAAREESAEAAAEESTEAAAEAAREAVREAAREESTEVAREEWTEAAREEWTELAREESTEAETEAVREAAREEETEAPTETAIDFAPEIDNDETDDDEVDEFEESIHTLNLVKKSQLIAGVAAFSPLLGVASIAVCVGATWLPMTSNEQSAVIAMGVIGIIRCVLQQIALMKKRGRRHRDIAANELSLPLFLHVMKEMWGESKLLPRMKGLFRLIKSFFGSWIGTQWMELATGLMTCVPLMVMLAADKIPNSANVDLLIALGVGSVVVATTSLVSDTYPQYKIFPVDESFRLISILKSLTLAVKGLILAESASMQTATTSSAEKAWLETATKLLNNTLLAQYIFTFAFSFFLTFVDVRALWKVSSKLPMPNGKTFLLGYVWTFFITKVAAILLPFADKLGTLFLSYRDVSLACDAKEFTTMSADRLQLVFTSLAIGMFFSISMNNEVARLNEICKKILISNASTERLSGEGIEAISTVIPVACLGLIVSLVALLRVSSLKREVTVSGRGTVTCTYEPIQCPIYDLCLSISVAMLFGYILLEIGLMRAPFWSQPKRRRTTNSRRAPARVRAPVRAPAPVRPTYYFQQQQQQPSQQLRIIQQPLLQQQPRIIQQQPIIMQQPRIIQQYPMMQAVRFVTVRTGLC